MTGQMYVKHPGEKRKKCRDRGRVLGSLITRRRERTCLLYTMSRRGIVRRHTAEPSLALATFTSSIFPYTFNERDKSGWLLAARLSLACNAILGLGASVGMAENRPMPVKQTIKKMLTTPQAQGIVAYLASRSSSRALLNFCYRHMGSRAHHQCWVLFAKLFQSLPARSDAGIWTVRFCGVDVALDLKTDSFWLDWDNALSILGADVDITETYSSIIASSERPDLFFDVGASYGMHSLLFLTHGIRTISVEPNPTCVDRFRELCAINNIVPQVEQKALWNIQGQATLRYSPLDTWRGAIATLNPGDRNSSTEMISIEVELTTLDHYLNEFQGNRALIKIDAEGAEELVLLGAGTILSSVRPLVIFESWPNVEQRERLFRLLSSHRYRVVTLPWSPHRRESTIDELAFVTAAAINFMAIPT